MTRRPMNDAERLASLREAIDAARGDWHEATSLLSVGADLHWLLERAVAASASDEGSLDAERLAIAINLTGELGAGWTSEPVYEFARRIAAEYARLRSTPPASEPEKP